MFVTHTIKYYLYQGINESELNCLVDIVKDETVKVYTRGEWSRKVEKRKKQPKKKLNEYRKQLDALRGGIEAESSSED